MPDNTANTEQKLNEQTAAQRSKPYKIAIIGASSVGKTTFFASYFYRVIRQSKGEIIAPDRSTGDAIDGLINGLFKKREATADKLPLDFNVVLDKEEMSIKLYDLPGGYVTDFEALGRHKISEDLADSDGAVFFISAEDTMNDIEKVTKNNGAFSHAIEALRSGERPDVPIIFLYTKCDAIPEGVGVNDLIDKNPALTNAAKARRGRFLFPLIHKTKVSCYKVSSMGKGWEDESIPPDAEHYEPSNVIEPMEYLLREMRNSRIRYQRDKWLRWVVLGVMVYFALAGLSYWFDRHIFNSASKNLKAALDSSEWNKAQRTAEAFSVRWQPLSWIGLEFLQSDTSAFYEGYEKAMYEKLRPDIEILDTTKMPSNPTLFFPAAERVEHYLANTEFFNVNAPNYENVRRYAPYYQAGKRLLSTNASSSHQELFTHINTDLAGISEFPQWREPLAVRIDRDVRAWVIAVSRGTEVDELRRTISNAEQLSAHPNMPQELAEFLQTQKARFEVTLAAAWEKLCSEWLEEAGKVDFDEAVRFLVSRSSEPELPYEQRERLASDLAQRYDVFLNDALNRGDERELQDILLQHPYMPSEQRLKVEQFLQALNKEELAGVLAALDELKNLDELLEEAGEIQEMYKRFPEILNDVKYALQRLVNREIETAHSRLNELGAKGDFGAAKQDMDTFFGDLLPRLSPMLSNLPNVDDIRSMIDDSAEKISNELMARDFEFCKSEFNSLRIRQDTQDIPRVMERLRGFSARWTSSVNELDEASKVISFLDVIRSGPEVKLIIVDGDFNEYGAWSLDTPDVYVEIKSKDGNLLGKTSTQEDNFTPHFGYEYTFTWTPATVLTFAAMDEDINFDGEIFNRTVEAAELFGYEKLTGEVSGEGNSINIKLEHNIPPCPWR